MVPMLIGYLDNYRYGLWMTIFSMLNWFQFFDIGLGNGLRNKYAECIASGDKELARIYVSTAYFLILIITVILFILFGISFSIIDWYEVFNVSRSLVKELNMLVLIVFGIQIINFPLKLISSMLLGAHRSAMANAFGPIGNVLSLLIIFFFNHSIKGSSLINVGIIYTAIPSLIYVLVSIYFFSTEFKDVTPSVKYVQTKYIKDLTGLGVKFFVLQINSLILISSTPLIIAHILGQESVTKYNVMFRLYNIPYMLYYILLTPFWSAFTSSYAKGDMSWIKNKLLVLLKICFGLTVFLTLILFFNKVIFHFWVGNKILPSQPTGIYLSVYTIVMMLLLPYNFLVNGAGKVRLQLYVSCIVTILNIPLSIWFGRNLHLGIDGVVIANIICMIPLVTAMAIQTYKIINRRAIGIWDK